MTSIRKQRAWLRLSLCHTIGPKAWSRWLVDLDQAGLSLEEFLELPEYQARPFVQSRPEIERWLRFEGPRDDQLAQIHRHLDERGVRILPINDPHYPRRLLRDLGIDAPTFLFVAGNLGHWRATTVGIVGTRNPSPQGEETARAYAAALAKQGIHVIGGHARGVDVAAHAGALDVGGSTTLVLPKGIMNFRAAPEIGELITPENGLIVSQFPPDLVGGRSQPVIRNTTVASLADGLIVVECGLISGTSYTFKEAKRFRKPLWSVIYSEPVMASAEGNHSLLSSGAKPLKPGREGAEECVSDLVKRLRAEHSAQRAAPTWPPDESSGQQELF